MTVTTAISRVNPETSSLSYRGYPVQELAAGCCFEQVAYLLWHGELPTPVQLDAQNRAERAQRSLDPIAAAILTGLPVTAHPMDTLRTAVSLLGASDPLESDNSPGAIRAKSLRLFAVVPSIVAMDQRRRHGYGAIRPRDDLGYAANFLYVTSGEVPDPAIVAEFETSLILHAEYGFNASTLTARIVTSTMSDLYSAVAAAIGALKGEARSTAYHLAGFDPPAFTPIVAAARIAGWTAHIAEQLRANRLIRPLAAYTGPAERAVGG